MRLQALESLPMWLLLLAALPVPLVMVQGFTSTISRGTKRPSIKDLPSATPFTRVGSSSCLFSMNVDGTVEGERVTTSAASLSHESLSPALTLSKKVVVVDAEKTRGDNGPTILGYNQEQHLELEQQEEIKQDLMDWGRSLAIATSVGIAATVASVDLHIPQTIWAWYEHSLALHPLYTKSMTSGVVYALGDGIAQRVEAANTNELEQQQVNLPRMLRSLLAGMIGHGPLSHLYYNLSENLFAHTLHWTAWWSVFPKIVVDQTMFGPFWNNFYLLILGLLKRDSLEFIGQDMKRTTIPLVVEGLKLWPAAHCITFGLIPVDNRLLWVDLVEIVWVTILATTAAEQPQPIVTTTGDEDDTPMPILSTANVAFASAENGTSIQT